MGEGRPFTTVKTPREFREHKMKVAHKGGGDICCVQRVEGEDNYKLCNLQKAQIVRNGSDLVKGGS